MALYIQIFRAPRTVTEKPRTETTSGDPEQRILTQIIMMRPGQEPHPEILNKEF